jgi:hypothetical protein
MEIVLYGVTGTRKAARRGTKEPDMGKNCSTYRLPSKTPHMLPPQAVKDAIRIKIFLIFTDMHKFAIEPKFTSLDHF